MRTALFDKTDFLGYVFDAIPSFMFIVDQDVQILHLNTAALNLLGGDESTILLKRGGEVLHCIHSTETPGGCGQAPRCADCIVRNSVNKAFRDERVHRETTKLEVLNDKGGGNIHFLVTASPLRYNAKDFVLLVMEDITLLKTAEEKLQRYAAQLEATNRELEAFSYSVSHDLKAPLRSISGFSQILIEDYAPTLDDEAKDHLQRINQAGIRMSSLVDDMLRLSQVTRDELRREKVDLSALAREVAEETGASLTDRRREFVITPNLRVNGDSRLLRIVLENLIGNAVKFTSSSRNARIEIGALAQGGRPVFFVKDNGCGFDMAHAAKLFVPFERLHNAAEFPGTGIGLATVQRIIHRHGGRIWAEGSVHQGAAFYFTL